MRTFKSAFFTSVLLAASLVALSSPVTNADETSTTTSSPSASPTPLAVTKTSNGVYALGNVGPGGGFIFYVNAKGFKCGPNFTSTGSPTGGLCHYMEVAPSGWYDGKPGSRDPYLHWSSDANFRKAVKGVTYLDGQCAGYGAKGVPTCLATSGIGNGFKNSVAIVKQGNNATTAAGASRAYKGGSLNDWYLPTLAELNNLLKWGQGVPWKSDQTVVTGGTTNSPTYGATTAGLDSSAYWSSTEMYRQGEGQTKGVPLNPKYAHNVAWLIFNIFTYDTLKLSGADKNGGVYVRPIRAF